MSAKREENKGDVAALKKIDTAFLKLHGTANHVVVYRYNSSTHSWNKTDTSGNLFLYERSVQPQLGLVVMNAKETTHFIQQFGSDAVFVMHQPYLLIRAAEDLRYDPKDDEHVIYCIWFYESQHCVDTANILRNIGLKFEGEGETFDKVGGQHRCQMTVNSPTSMGDHAGNHLFQILRTGTKEDAVEGNPHAFYKKCAAGHESDGQLNIKTAEEKGHDEYKKAVSDHAKEGRFY